MSLFEDFNYRFDEYMDFLEINNEFFGFYFKNDDKFSKYL